MTFIEALQSGDIENIRQFPKADLHNHFVLGGGRDYILKETGHDIKPLSRPLVSMREIDEWNGRYIGQHFNSPEGRKFLIEAAFAQAKYDGVTLLEIGEDVWGLGEFFHHDAGELIYTFQEINNRVAQL
jgi:hypothetical protein